MICEIKVCFVDLDCLDYKPSQLLTYLGQKHNRDCAKEV